MDANQKAEADKQIKVIKDHMPGVLQAIRTEASIRGDSVYGLVRRGVLGEADCFYALEGGRVIGTPFAAASMVEVALQIVQFGVTYLLMLAPAMVEGGDGKA